MRVDGPALGWTDLVGAIRRIHDGERDVNTFLDGLDNEASMILAGLDDPSTLADLLASIEGE